ncbi:MFS transporter [Streptomyces sp. Agncl-13]|uniref:MFS transporter n=1 Tax=Streptomyces sp. Agncl-13 TaxID=3400628 RepID=UPI003A85CA91
MSAPLLSDQAGPPTESPARRRNGLLVLATTTFVVVTRELLPVGLLTPIGDDLGVARSRVGLLVTVYAFSVGLTAAPLTHWTAGRPRKHLYLTVSAVFSLGTVLSAAAENYPMLAIGRFLCGMVHGVFWSIVAGYAAAPGRSGRATAVVFAGNSTALVLGVPLGTVLGGVVGWRGAFWAAAALGLGALAAARRFLPDVPHRSAPPRSTGLGSALRLPGLRSLVAATALLVLGHFTVYTYVTPLLHDTAAFSEAATSMLLALSDTTVDVADEAMASARRHNVTASYDPNYRPSLWADRGGAARAREIGPRLARHADVVVGALCLAGPYPGVDRVLFTAR